MYCKLSPFNGWIWYPLGKFSHLGMEQIKSIWEYFMRGSSRLLNVSPSGIFGIITWPNCHVFINVRSFYECCDKMFVHAYDRCMYKISVKGICWDFVDFFSTNVCGCISLCIILWDCIQNWLTWGKIFGWCVCHLGKDAVHLRSSGYSCPNK